MPNTKRKAKPVVGDIGPKLGELILHVAARSEADPYFGAAKLNKILFYSDFLAFSKWGAAITGTVYEKRHDGPAPRHLPQALEDLKAAAACVERERDHLGLRQRRLLPLRDPELSIFSPQEIALVDEVIFMLWKHATTEASELSHRFHGWIVAREGEEIPYSTVYVGEPRPLSPGELAYAEQLEREL